MPDSGSAQLAALAARLKAVGNKGLRLQMLRGLKAGAKPLVGDVKAAALAKLPHSGGLSAHVAGQKVSVSVRTGARTAGIRLTTKDLDTKDTNSGFVRHPVFGRWLPDQPDQSIPEAAGWWSQTLAEKSPEVTPELLAVMRTVAAEIDGI